MLTTATATPTVTIPSSFAVTMSDRAAAVVSSVSSVPRSFSPLMASTAMMEPPVSIRSRRKGVSARPRSAPPSFSALAVFSVSTVATCSGATGKPRER